jgi:hypothetical protein
MSQCPVPDFLSTGKKEKAMKNHPICVLLLLTLSLWPNFSFAQQESGASRKPPEQLGNVYFPTSCQSAVQPTFERGVALLHSFWWKEGEKTFREVLERDPNCAIATWGIAAILIGNTFKEQLLGDRSGSTTFGRHRMAGLRKRQSG